MSLISTIYKIPDFTSSDKAIDKKLIRLIVVIQSKELNAETEVLLNNIIAAIKLQNSSQFAIIKSDQNKPVSFNQILKNVKSAKVIFFGCQLDKLGLFLKLSMNEVIDFGNHRLLYTSSLSEMLTEQKKGNKHLKIKLWNSIKTLFNI